MHTVLVLHRFTPDSIILLVYLFQRWIYQVEEIHGNELEQGSEAPVVAETVPSTIVSEQTTTSTSAVGTARSGASGPAGTPLILEQSEHTPQPAASTHHAD